MIKVILTNRLNSQYMETSWREFPGGPALGLSTFTAMTPSSILRQGTKTLQTIQHSQKKKKQLWGQGEGGGDRSTFRLTFEY